MLTLFSWLLTSSNRWLRDTTSKAMIEILRDHFEYAEYLLKLFSDVNDPYVIQRLYGIVFGACVKRNCENKELFKSLVGFVFNDIFNKDFIYPDILLRDYARLIIERYMMEYPSEPQDFKYEKIKPPYKSIRIPDIADQKYQDQDFKKGLFCIQQSMQFEGIGMYGDFGRYVFQSALRNFDVDNYKIFNYAMYYIINELGYKGEWFDDYDNFANHLSRNRHHVIKIERIGKKYQWIAMYNILARISDYYPMKDQFSMEKEYVSYDGPWEPYVRDFDPTLNEHNLYCNNAPYFPQVKEHIRVLAKENNHAKTDPTFNEELWLNSNSIFFEQQQKDLLLYDENGNQWVVLSKYADTGRTNLTYNKLMTWNWLYGYFVTDEQLVVLKEYAGKHINLINSDIAYIPETYVLYNREYPWSSGSKAMTEWQWKDIELTIDETRLKVTKTHQRKVPVTINLGKALNTTQDILWEEEFDASKENALSNSHPCAEIINALKLGQRNMMDIIMMKRVLL